MTSNFALFGSAHKPLDLASGSQGDVFFRWKKLDLGRVNKITNNGTWVYVENLTCRERYQGLRIGNLLAYQLAAAIKSAWPDVAEIRFESFSYFDPNADHFKLSQMRAASFNKLCLGAAINPNPNSKQPNMFIVTHVWPKANWNIEDLAAKQTEIQRKLRWWARLYRWIRKKLLKMKGGFLQTIKALLPPR